MVQGSDQGLHVVAVELRSWQRLGILVLDAPNAGEVVIPIRARGRIAGAVTRTPGVIVDGDLIVEIDQIDGPVWAYAAVNGTEPVVGAGEELGLLATVFFAALIGRALRVQELVVEELACGLTHEERIPLGGRPLGRPSAAVINCRARGCGPSPHPVDLYVRLALLIEGRVNLVLLNDIEERLHAAHLSASQDLLRDHHVADGFAAGGRREEDFVVGCDLTAPSIATPGGDLLDRGAIGFEAVNTRGDVAEVLGSVARLHASAGVAHRSVNPAIHAPAEIANDRMGVEGTPAGVEGFNLVRPTVTIGVPNPQDVWGLSHDHAVFPEHQRGGQFQTVSKEGALVGHAIAVGVFQNGDAIERLARLLAANREGLGVLGSVPIGLEVILVHVATSRVLGRLHHPQATLLVPVHRHDLLGHVLVGRQGHIELRMSLEGLERLGSGLRAPGRVLERSQFLGLTELIGVGALTGPGDAAQQNGPVMGSVERVVLVAGDADKGPVRCLGLGQGLLISPQLGPNIEDIDKTLGQHVDVLGHIEAVVDLVLPVEVGHTLHNRVLRIDEIDPDIALVPLSLLLAIPAPGAADDLLAPLVLITADHAVMEHHHATTAGQEVLEAPTLVADDFHAVGRVYHQHIGRLQLGLCREFHSAAGGDSSLGEELGPFTQESRMIVLVGAVGFDAAADKDAERSGVKSDGERQQGPHRQEGSKELFHGLSQTTQIADAVADARIQVRIDPPGTHDGKGEPGQSMDAL